MIQRPLIRKTDALRLYDDNATKLALAIGLTRQAVASWGRFLPELAARRLLELHPTVPCGRAQIKLIRKPRHNGR